MRAAIRAIVIVLVVTVALLAVDSRPSALFDGVAELAQPCAT
jgi:hypothetical protein